VLIIDHYEPFNLGEILIPFSAEYESLPSALGTIAFYLFLMVIMSSDLWMRTMNRSLWKKLHFLVLPAWVLSLAHGVLIGTDSEKPVILLFYLISAGLILSVLIARTAGQLTRKADVSMSHQK